MFLDAVFALAVWVAENRTGKPRAIALAFLNAVTEDHIISLGMAADAAAEAMGLTRFWTMISTMLQMPLKWWTNFSVGAIQSLCSRGTPRRDTLHKR